MFQLIVVAISILLFVGLALAAIWFGGEAFTGSNEKATFAKYLNHGAQIEGSLKLYRNDKAQMPTGSTDEIFTTLLTDQYLKSVPDGSWHIEGASIYKPLSDMDQCKRFNAYMGKPVDNVEGGCPPCVGDGSETYTDWPACRREEIVEPVNNPVTP